MKNRFHGLFGKRWKFQKGNLTESSAELKNPARGWYQIHTFLAEETFSSEELVWCLNKEDTLALVLIDLGAYKDQSLDEVTLSNVERILGFFVEKGLEIILRLTYDHEGKAQEREPFFFSKVTEHVTQLGPIISKYAQHIFVYQGLLVGNWGEMHTSRFLSTEKLGRLASLLSGYLGEDTYLAVRRPSYWRALQPEFIGKENYRGTGMGLFDDAIFGSDTHLGTFGATREGEFGWEDAWPIEEELTFEERLGNYAPQGGEALYEEGAAEARQLSEAVKRLRRMRVTYLNRVHDKRQLMLWKEQRWSESGPFQGMNGYDYIGRHLGYRFCVRTVSASFSRGQAQTCSFQIDIENTGFARCYHRTAAWLEWESENGICRQELDLDLSCILPGEIKTGNCTIVPAPGPVYLCAKRRKDNAPIYFANVQEDMKGILLGTLLL